MKNFIFSLSMSNCHQAGRRPAVSQSHAARRGAACDCEPNRRAPPWIPTQSSSSKQPLSGIQVSSRPMSLPMFAIVPNDKNISI
ncbi:hypothetical protein HHL24_14115 [Paraburkholderia sp. RP-4-7]|uniref:Uncharacterized protein n=1 Tax=Paraburkholderia polaris TaxID=2728848 RepID=A0A848ID22_9BURK|nr:hypothetical protein [Paraburkholderia polaris]NML99072.1 hypothetical protein [Paraburkholderia polaris]